MTDEITYRKLPSNNYQAFVGKFHIASLFRPAQFSPRGGWKPGTEYRVKQCKAYSAEYLPALRAYAEQLTVALKVAKRLKGKP